MASQKELRNGLTQQYLRELFDYVDGNLIWKVSKARVSLGQVAGAISGTDNYVYIKINQVRYGAHRLIWLYHFGAWPTEELDHIDRIRTNNRIENLREVNKSRNLHNCKLFDTNTSGFNGVSYKKDKNKLKSEVCINQNRYFIGYFDTAEQAGLACKVFKDEFLG